MNKILVIMGVVLIVAGIWLYFYDSPKYLRIDFLSKFITAAGIFMALLAYYASTRKDKADDDRAKNAIAFSLINQWQIPPFTDYIADIVKMERVDRTTTELYNKKNAVDFASLLEGPFYAHYRRSFFIDQYSLIFNMIIVFTLPMNKK